MRTKAAGRRSPKQPIMRSHLWTYSPRQLCISGYYPKMQEYHTTMHEANSGIEHDHGVPATMHQANSGIGHDHGTPTTRRNLQFARLRPGARRCRGKGRDGPGVLADLPPL